MAVSEPTVAGYRKTRVLRRDALGDVYQATHEKTNMSVCLRVLASPEAMDGAEWEELRYRLVGTLFQLQQLGPLPGIERVEGVGKVANSLWIVTEFLDGMTLEDRRQTSGPTPYSEALPVLKQVAQTLDEIHDRGFAHGWLSAEHVLLTNDGGVRLLGVGLGLMPGCYAPKYAAPERPDEGPSRAGDIYAFGILLRKVLGGEQITLPVRAVLDRLTADDPSNRYRRAGEAISDLEEGKIPMPIAGAVKTDVAPPAEIPVTVPPVVGNPPAGAPPIPMPTVPPPASGPGYAVTPAVTPVAYGPNPTAVVGAAGALSANGVAAHAAPAAPTYPTNRLNPIAGNPPAGASPTPLSPSPAASRPDPPTPSSSGNAGSAAIMPTARRKQAEAFWMAVAVVAFIVAVGGLWWLLGVMKGSNAAATTNGGETPKASPTATHASAPKKPKKPKPQ